VCKTFGLMLTIMNRDSGDEGMVKRLRALSGEPMSSSSSCLPLDTELWCLRSKRAPQPNFSVIRYDFFSPFNCCRY
jgi:hypothetical protein